MLGDGDLANQAGHHAGAHAVDDHGVAQNVDEAARQQVGGHSVATSGCGADQQVALLHFVRHKQATGRLAQHLGLSFGALALESGGALGGLVAGVAQGVQGAHQAVLLDFFLVHANVSGGHGLGAHDAQGFGLELLDSVAGLDGFHGQLSATGNGGCDFGDVGGVVTLVDDFDDGISHFGTFEWFDGGGNFGALCRHGLGQSGHGHGSGGCCVGLLAAAHANAGVCWHGDQRNFVRRPRGHAVGFHTILCALE